MKKLMMICGLLFSMTAFAQAQQNGKPGEGKDGRMGMTPEARVGKIAEKLNLSADQKTKLTAIFTEQAEAQKKQREAGKGTEDRVARVEKMKQQRTELDAKIDNILDANQKEAYKAMKEEQKAEMQKRNEERKAKKVN